MSLKTKTVKLTAPIIVFDKRYTEIVIREPSGSVYFELGPLAATYRNGDLTSTYNLPGVLKSYLERCVVNIPEPQVAMTLALTELGMEDSMKLERAFESFFTEAFGRVFSAADPKPGADGASASQN